MTSIVKQYKNPPIKEAIFSFSFKEPIEDNKLDLFKELDSIKKVYPIQNPSEGFEINVSNRKVEGTSISPGVTVNHRMRKGYRLRNDYSLIDIKPTQFTYHSINKYKGWEFVLGDLKNLFGEFLRVVVPSDVSQLSTRYINQIGLPNTDDISEYIKLLPDVPEELNPLESFFLQITKIDNSTMLIGTITETILPTTTIENKFDFLLDIAVVKNIQEDTSDIWETFEQIRTFKNKLFNSCITAKTEQLFDL